MQTTVEFLDAVRTRHRLTSDYKLAKFLGVPQQTVSSYRNGRSMMDETMCLKIAAALELEPGDVLVAIATEREKRPEVKTAWQRVAKRLAGVSGVALLCLVPILHIQDVRAEPLAAAEPNYTYATKRRRRLTRRALAAFLALCRALVATLAFTAANAQAAEWTWADTAREASYQGLLAVDCSQTRYGASHPDQFAEGNRLMGEHPSKGKINNVCFGVGVGHYLISRWLPRDGRTAWQGVTIGIELYAVDSNRMVGARIEF